MTKYLSLCFHFLKFNLIHEMEFRKNFYIRLITQFFFVALQIIIVNTFFHFTNALGVWSKSEVFLLVGIFRLIEGAFHMFIHSNLLTLPEQVNSGELDLLLSKPINTLFMVSLRRHKLYELSTFASGVLIIVYTHLISIQNILSLIILSILGFIALYAIMLAFSSLSFFIPRLTALSSIWDVVSKVTRFPLDIFSSSTRLTIYFLGPLFLVATLPSQLILSKIPWEFITLQIAGTAILCILAYLFWLYSLRHYSSASS